MSLVVHEDSWADTRGTSDCSETPELAKAIDALVQGRLLPHFVDSLGIKRTISTATQIISLLQQGYCLRQVNNLFYFSRGLFGGDPNANEFSSTEQLSAALKDKDLSDSRHIAMQKLAMNAVEVFRKIPISCKPHIDEAVALVFADNVQISKALLEAFVEKIEGTEEINIDILDAIRVTLVNARVGSLDPKILKNLIETVLYRTRTSYDRDRSNSKVTVALSIISDILDVISDSKVIRVKSINTSDPSYASLDFFCKSSDILTSSLAAYAKEALMRIPSQESKVDRLLTVNGSIENEWASLIRKIPVDNTVEMEEFHGFLGQKIDESFLFRSTRYIRFLFLRKEYLKLIKELGSFSDCHHAEEVTNMLFVLRQVVLTASVEKVKGLAVEQMVRFFLNSSICGGNKTLKRKILQELVVCAENAKAHRLVIKALRELEGEVQKLEDTDKLGSIFFATVDFSMIKPDVNGADEQQSILLIEEAKKMCQSSIPARIEEAKNRRLSDPIFRNGIASFMPLFAKVGQSIRTIDLDEAIAQFVATDQKAFIIRGEAGVGKTTQLRHLEDLYWNRWNPESSPSSPIPLCINMSVSNKSLDEAIRDELLDRGFKTEEIPTLKFNHNFLFLLDDCGPSIKVGVLDSWRGSKAIIAFSSKHVSASSSDIQTEATILPFSRNQIEELVGKFFQSQSLPGTAIEYTILKESIPNLEGLLQNQLLLRATVEVLSAFVDKDESDRRAVQLLLVDILDSFTRNWFERQIFRLQSTKEIDFSSDVESLLALFVADLAYTMEQNEVTSFPADLSNERAGGSESLWNRFIAPKNLHILQSIPIRRRDDSSYEFLSPILQKYFCARAILPLKWDSGKPLVDVEKLNNLDLTKKPEIIDLLAEIVLRKEALKENLFQVIYRTKEDDSYATAAANAITILNAARINLSGRDFKGVHIPGADLSYAFITNVDFTGSNLEGVFFVDTNLSHTVLCKARLAGIQLDPPLVSGSGQVSNSAVPYAIAKSQKRIQNNFEKKIVTGGNVAITVDSAGQLRCWNSRTGLLYPPFRGHQRRVTSLAISSDERYAVSGDGSGQVFCWNCQTGERQSSFSKRERITSLAISSDGSRVASGDTRGQVFCWNSKTGDLYSSFDRHTSLISALAISEDGKWVISADSEGVVNSWNSSTGAVDKEIKHLTRHSVIVDHVVISSDGRRAISFSSDGFIVFMVHNMQNRVESVGPRSSIAISPDGTTVFLGNEQGFVDIVNVKEDVIDFAGKLKIGRPIRLVRCLPDNQILIVTDQPTFQIWQSSNKEKGHYPYLRWSSASSNFSTLHTRIEGDVELSRNDKESLLRMSTADNPSRCSVM